MVRIHETPANRVVIGPGSLGWVTDEVERAGGTRVLLIASRSATAVADTVVGALGERVVMRFDRPAVHTPVEVTDEVMAEVGSDNVDAVVAIGGGSAIGLSKAVSARSGVPQVVVPTTYAGSEVTPVLGETRDGVKTTRRDVTLLPGTVVYDPELTLSLPAGLTLTSSLNAVAHSVEALWAPDATAVSDALATESVQRILGALPLVLSDLRDIEARRRLQTGAWLAGLCLAQTQMGLHHQLAHALGGTFDLPHAELHALLLAHVMRFNLPHTPGVAARLSRVVSGDPVVVVEDFARSHHGATTLRELGVPHDRMIAIADRVIASPYPNPRPIERGPLVDLLDSAWG
ncbi:alcohol dehydrogenase [Nocardioides sp. Root190]|uniref:maleylacetate reductase n=1 Tax=Nocardioides sp. Root190 TaxID=1736488 RepID=UPI0006F53B68|nr:maleylacetate reductase [Nocardioides sp. Root190]KRB75103.1 alcohol dehydrogenase [Nocardioides sp. Root190]